MNVCSNGLCNGSTSHWTVPNGKVPHSSAFSTSPASKFFRYFAFQSDIFQVIYLSVTSSKYFIFQSNIFQILYLSVRYLLGTYLTVNYLLSTLSFSQMFQIDQNIFYQILVSISNFVSYCFLI